MGGLDARHTSRSRCPRAFAHQVGLPLLRSLRPPRSGRARRRGGGGHGRARSRSEVARGGGPSRPQEACAARVLLAEVVAEVEPVTEDIPGLRAPSRLWRMARTSPGGRPDRPERRGFVAWRRYPVQAAAFVASTEGEWLSGSARRPRGCAPSARTHRRGWPRRRRPRRSLRPRRRLRAPWRRRPSLRSPPR